MIDFYTTGYGYSKRLCEDVVCWFVSKYVSRYKLEIEVLHRGMKREGFLGLCDVAGSTTRPREFLIEIDTHLDKETYVKTLIHEMIHLLQWVKGDLKLKASKKYYKGECVEDFDYWEQKHEIEAHSKETILYQEYLQDKHLTHL